MKGTFTRVLSAACVGGTGCGVSSFAGGALKGISMLRTLLLVAAMVIVAASSWAQEAQAIGDYEDLEEACHGSKWSEVSDFKLTEDIAGGGTIDVMRSLTLDLDGHSITISRGNVNIHEGSTLTIIDGSADPTKAIISCMGEDGGDAIYIYEGCRFNATGISISNTNGGAVSNLGGTATLTGCTLSGSIGFYNSGTASVTGCTISGTETAIENSGGTLSIATDNNYTACTISGGNNGISNGLGGTVSIGAGVSIKTYSASGITNAGGIVTLNAWPTFGAGGENNVTDIWLLKGNVITIGEAINAAPTARIKVRVTDNSDKDLGAADLPYAFTEGYAAKVRYDESNVIKPSEVFTYYDSSRLLGVRLDAETNSEAAIYRGVTFAFAEGQEWMTWCSENNYQMPSGITAYRITDAGATSVVVAEVGGETLPGHMPLLLQKNAAGSLSAVLIGPCTDYDTGFNDATGIVSAACLGGTAYGATADATAEAMTPLWAAGRSYMLRGGEFVLIDDISQGISANRCWLTLDAETGSNAARRLTIDLGGDATGIQTPPLTPPLEGRGVEDAQPLPTPEGAGWPKAGAGCYDLQGRRVTAPRKGIYISRGKKKILK